MTPLPSSSFNPPRFTIPLWQPSLLPAARFSSCLCYFPPLFRRRRRRLVGAAHAEWARPGP